MKRLILVAAVAAAFEPLYRGLQNHMARTGLLLAMDDTQAIPRGVTACFSRAGLAIGDGAKTGPAIVAPNGAGIDYAIAGVAFFKAEAATVLPLTAAAVQAVDTTCIYLMQIDSAGTVTSVKSNEELNTALANGTRVLHYPEPAANKCPFGAVKIKTVAVTFTPGTTALDAAGITATYINFAGAMPQAPLTS